MSTPIEHVFVLMLENRSFDHLLGFSGITGTDAVTGTPTQLNGLTGAESNSFNGEVFSATPTASLTIAVDPGHEFPEVVEQLCGAGVKYVKSQPYPPINNGGFAASYACVIASAQKQASPGEVLKGYSPAQLPVLNALAREFAICDNWYASVPGATWPNRLFVHAASSNGLDHSPTTAEIAIWEALDGFEFLNGHIFDRLRTKGLMHRLYAGDDFPMIAALKGIHLDDIRDYSLFANDVRSTTFPYNYIFIEPSYDLQNDYRDSSSQHPLGSVTAGEALIKNTYEAIRNSPLWESSLLIVTWDEHGGFYDHVAPPVAPAPGDSNPSEGHNKFGFTFEQYGVRVPAVIVSPWIQRNTIDHRIYDHSSVPATVEAIFDVGALTNRDATANNVLPLLTLASPRTDAPATLPEPAFGPSGMAAGPHLIRSMQAVATPTVARPEGTINDGNLPVVVHAALRQDLELSPESERQNILAKVASLKTRNDAANYLDTVQQKIAASRAHQK